MMIDARHAFQLVICWMLATSATGQASVWTQDGEWAEEGWSTGSLGDWHEVVDVVPWQNQAVAVVNVYSADGSLVPFACRWDESGNRWHWPLKAEDDSTQYAIAALDADPSGQLWAVGSEQQNVDGWTSDWAWWPIEEGGVLDTANAVYVNFGSPFQVMFGWDVSPASEVWGVATGYVLDPCCFHRELPTLVEVSADQGVTTVVFDVGSETTADTLGMRPAHDRHEVGGAYHCAVPLPEGGWIAAGAYSNAAHYEVLVAKHAPDGTLVEAFGESGWFHINLNPGANHWVADAVIIEGRLYLQVQSHNGGELNPGWHQLEVDAQSGELLGWASFDGMEAVHTDGYHQGAGSVVGFYDAENPRVIDPSEMSEVALTPAIDSGSWAHIKTTYHAEWSRWVTAGQQQLSGATTLAASTWIEPSLGQPSLYKQVDAPFPNPVKRGEGLHLPACCELHPCVLHDGRGAQAWTTIMSTGNPVPFPETLPAGLYILRSADQASGWRLLVE